MDLADTYEYEFAGSGEYVAAVRVASSSPGAYVSLQLASSTDGGGVQAVPMWQDVDLTQHDVYLHTRRPGVRPTPASRDRRAVDQVDTIRS